MNRVLLLIVLIIAVTVVLIVVGLAGRSSAPPDPVSAGAERYALLLSSQSDHYITVRRIVRAADPAAMRSQMSDLTYSDNLFFRSSYPLVASLQPGGRGIPYPPEEAWCASLAADDQTDATIVVIARHMDLYNSEWILHTLVDPAATAAAIGCKLNK
jgi:hypothetical protein